MAPDPPGQSPSDRTLFAQLKRMEAALAETRDLVAGNGREPGLAELVRALTKAVDLMNQRLAEQAALTAEHDAQLDKHATDLLLLHQAPDVRLAGAVKALWVPLAAATLIAFAGLAALGMGLKLMSAAQAMPMQPPASAPPNP